MGYLRSKLPLLAVVFFFCFSIIFVRWYNTPVTDPTFPPRSATYGDAWSSLNSYSAAMYFKDFGFKRSYGLPVFGYKGNMDTSGIYTYTHYPPIPDEIAGAVATVSGTNDIKILCLFPIFISCCFFFIIYYVLQRMFSNPAGAFAAATLTVISCYFISWADDLHQHVYSEICRWGYIFLLFVYYDEQRKRPVIFAALALLYLINSNLSYEHIIYYAVVTVGFSLIYTRKLFTVENVVLLFIPVLGYFLHMCQNYMHFKSWHGVFADIKSQYMERAVGDENVKMNAERWKEMPENMAIRFTRVFFVNPYSFIVLAVFGFRYLYQSNRKFFWLGWTLFAATLTWIFFMPQHAYIHLFTIKHFGFLYAFILAAALPYYWGFLKEHFAHRKVVFIAMHSIFILFTIGVAAYSQCYYVYLKYGYMFPKLGINHNLY